MVIAAWIVFIISVGLIITHILLYKKNEAYQNRIKTIFKRKWTIVIKILMTVVLVYTIATSFLIMVQGDCFVGYYNKTDWVGLFPFNYFTVVYYKGHGYMFITNGEEDLLKEAYEYGAGEWEYTDTYIIGENSVGFPYFEYWCPKIFRGEVIVPGDLEPIYIRVISQGHTTDYIRIDILEERQK